MGSKTVPTIVAYEPQNGVPNFKFEELSLTKQEPGDHEVLVRVIASGICHTDLVVGSLPTGYSGVYPKVIGHEGSGYVEAVGSSVKSVQVGDPVLLSFTYDGTCDLCKYDHPAYCENWSELNAVCPEKLWKTSDGKEVGGKFFGQSSWSALSMCDEKSCVNAKDLIKNEDDLKLFSPLGCGLMTGSGAVINAAKLKPHNAILVTGLGAVGIGAIMAAKIAGAKAIIALDRVDSRLALAKEIGATHTYNTTYLDSSKEGNFTEEVKALAPDGKIDFIFETTGVVSVINAAFGTLSKRGKLYQIGVPNPVPSPIWNLNVMEWFAGLKQIEVNYLGNADTQTYIPQMIQWYREGKFPFDKLVKFYPAKDFATAIEDMKTEVIKPVLLH